jgi:signal recognition particle GTPase
LLKILLFREMSEDSIWFYFTKLADNSVKCQHCNNFSQKMDKTGSTGNMIRHLKEKHPELNSKRKKAVEAKQKRTTDSIPKITTLFASSSHAASPSSPEIENATPAKKSRIYSGSGANETIAANFSKLYIYLLHPRVFLTSCKYR